MMKKAIYTIIVISIGLSISFCTTIISNRGRVYNFDGNKLNYKLVFENKHKEEIKDSLIFIFESWFENDTIQIRNKELINKVLNTHETLGLAGYYSISLNDIDNVFIRLNDYAEIDLPVNSRYGFVRVRLDRNKNEIIFIFTNDEPGYL